MGSREICFSQNCTKLWKKLDVICLSSILCDWLVRGVILKSQMFADFKKLYYWKKDLFILRILFGVFSEQKIEFLVRKVVHAASSGSLLASMFKSMNANESLSCFKVPQLA